MVRVVLPRLGCLAASHQSQAVRQPSQAAESAPEPPAALHGSAWLGGGSKPSTAVPNRQSCPSSPLLLSGGRVEATDTYKYAHDSYIKPSKRYSKCADLDNEATRYGLLPEHSC